jgi:carbamoyl-phosphate synthase large subunit
MKKTYNILVTGCGGDISQSMGKILRQYPRADRVIGCDIHNDHAGHFIFHECFLVERASSPNYLTVLKKLIIDQQVDIVVPATEYELEFLVTNPDANLGDCKVIRPNDFAIQTGLDKYVTAKFLEKSGLPFPRTELLENLQQVDLPCIVKSRRGSGSKSLYVVHDQNTFDLVKKLAKDAVCQQYLGKAEDEFTCGIFRSNKYVIRTIIFRRKLTGGFSGFGIVEKNEAIEKLLVQLATALDLKGCINAQLRLHNGIPVIFEINARFSSTVLFRHMLGFEDLIWAIEDELGLPLKAYIESPAGSKFYKGFQEYIVKA